MEKKSYEISNDSFGNTFIKFDEPNLNVEKVHDLIQEVKNKNKAVILVNIEEKIIDELNLNYYKNDIIFLAKNDNIPYYLFVNNSNCPQFCDSKIFASGVSIILKYDNNFYALLVKDKTKKILTCIGGTCQRSDYLTNKSYAINTAVRELNEETIGSIKISDEIIKTNGLILTSFEYLKPFCEIEFESKYYGLKIPDFYKCYCCFADINFSDDTYWKLLFDPRNKLPNNDYKMNYLDNDETEYIYAIKIKDDVKNIENIKEQISGINLENSRISTLNMFLNYVHFDKLQNEKTLKFTIEDDLTLFSKLNVSSLRSIKWEQIKSNL